MARDVIVTTLDHHPATKALGRVTALLEHSKDGYAVERLEYVVQSPEHLTARISGVLGDHVFFTTDVLGDHPEQSGSCTGVGCGWTGTAEEHDDHQAQKIAEEITP